MKLTLFITILYVVALLTSCDKTPTSVGADTPPPDPVEVLKGQVAAERQMRRDAVQVAEEETKSKEAWQLVTLCLAVVTVVAFVGGTAIGSRGKRHADTRED